MPARRLHNLRSAGNVLQGHNQLACMLQVSVTGALGKRTEAQAEAKAQLVLRVQRLSAADAAAKSAAASTHAASSASAPDVAADATAHARVRSAAAASHHASQQDSSKCATNQSTPATTAQVHPSSHILNEAELKVDDVGERMEAVAPRLAEGSQAWAGWQDDSGVHNVPQLQDGTGVYKPA